MTKQSEFHIGVKDAVIVRKDLLETAKAVIQLLQRFESIRALRKERRATINKLKGLMKEIVELNGQLKLVFPKTPAVNVRAKKHKPASSIPVPKSEVDKLNSELASIESKLAGL